MAYEGVRGPCYIELPVNIARRKIRRYSPPKKYGRSRRPDPDGSVLDFVSTLICNSERPLIIAGSGILSKRAIDTSKALERLAEEHGIPVVATIMGKSAISNQSKFYVGILGVDADTQGFIDRADLIVTVGYEFAEYGPEKWNGSESPRVAHIGYVPAERTHFYPLVPSETEDWDAQVIGDIKRSLEGLIERLEKNGYVTKNSDEVLEEINRIQSRKKREMEEIPPHSIPFYPLAVLSAVQSNISSDDIVICDVGTVKALSSEYLIIEKPNHFYAPNTLSPMGFALPFAIGCKLARPENRVIAICGDGSFKMSHSELEVAVEEKIPITILIFNNNQLGLITQNQEEDFGRTFGTRFRQKTNYVKMSKSMGVEAAFRVNSIEEIGKVLNSTRNLDEPMVIEIPTRDNSNVYGRSWLFFKIEKVEETSEYPGLYLRAENQNCL